MKTATDYEAKRESLKRTYLKPKAERHDNFLALFDFPENPMPPTREAIGGIHHIAIAVHPEHYDTVRARLDELHIDDLGPDRVENWLYFHGPDNELIEVTRDPLEEMEGQQLGV